MESLKFIFFTVSAEPQPEGRHTNQIVFFRHHPASKDNDLKCIDTEIGEISEIELAALAMPSKLPA